MMKGALIRTAVALTEVHLAAIIISTALILTGEIYFIGYSRVENKKERPFPQFFLKRFTALYGITLLVAIYLTYMFGIYLHVTNGWYDIVKVIIVVAMPCSIGAAIPSLMKQY